MERIEHINLARIEWCCRDYSIEPAQLAAHLGIKVTAIEEVLRGERGLTFSQLSKMAAYFGRGVLFFMESGQVDENVVHSMQFRTLANQKPEISPELKKLIERAEKQRDVYLGLQEDLDDDERIAFSPPALPADPVGAARIVRDWLALGDTNDFHSYRAAVEAKGVLVFRSNGYNGKWQIAKESSILGFTLYDDVCPVIVVKKQAFESMQSFTLMHELGHLLLEKKSSIDEDIEMQSHEGNERSANAFAGHLLVPDAFLQVINDNERPDDVGRLDDWLKPQRKFWGVSTEVILRRLLDAGRLPVALYTAYRAYRAKTSITDDGGGSREYRYREPKHIFGDRFVATVLGALYERRITLARASTYLDGLKIKDVHKLGQHYARL
ncbi:MAG: ImmA/IrrE family metallo-endopeptidase [Deltaproteobacteria bacterium]|nr:ImmA/IrrE family metallo-endopeptidase [Deltaproteobacteria bacterium]